MIFGVGVDIAHIPRFQDALNRFGERFSARILTDAELDDYRKSHRKTAYLAKHFAAKEALSKAIGTGFREGLSWRDIDVRRDPRGRPYLECMGRAREMLQERGITASHLSLSDEVEYVVAFVVLER